MFLALFTLIIFFICPSFLYSAPFIKINVTSSWIITNRNLNYSIPSSDIPSTIHEILYKNNLIDDPLYRYNDIEQRYLSRDDNWVYTNKLTLDSDEIKKANSISLTFDSIDTVASIYLNNILILETNNQFLRYTVDDIKPYLNLNPCYNILEVKFLSPINQARLAANTYPYRMPPECPPDVQKGECHVNMLRKKQCSFSWDWGPSIPNIGINGPVYITLLNTFNFEFSVSIYPRDDSLKSWVLDFLLDITKSDDNEQYFDAIIKIDEIDFENKTVLFSNKTKSQLNFSINLISDKLNLWWPNGFGDQKMYKLEVELTLVSESVNMYKNIGFKKVELVQELTPSKRSEHGLTFYFKINNIGIFLKGSNWIPAHVSQEKITTEYLNNLFYSAKISYMNVLRVWGGGVYESEDFYEFADQNGILIWQDFMFACAAYPTNSHFLDSVKLEVVYQVNRLRHHPSILIWAANNENEAAISTNWYGTDANKTLYANDYRKLYIETIKPIVEIYDKSHPFLSSSPTNGKESELENWLAKNPYDLNYGDLHFYDYSINSWFPESFPVPRFLSEFGVQSMPSFSTLFKIYNNESDMDLLSELNEHRQHHGNGNHEMIMEIEHNLKMPNFLEDKKLNFIRQIYLTQLNQGMHLATGNELCRRSRNYFNYKNGNGLCSGTMYWQFNDLWQAPTWASIEYGGKWKLSHYFVKRSYSKLHLSAIFNSTKIDIYAISDLFETIESQFFVKVYSYESFDAKYKEEFNFLIESQTAKSVASIDISDIEKKTGCRINNSRSCVLILSSTDHRFDNRDFINFLLFKTKLSDVTNLKIPNIFVQSVEKIEDGVFNIFLTTDQISLFVALDINTNSFLGYFSDNGFHMVNQTKMVTFKTNDLNVDTKEVLNSLSVHSLMNTYS